MVDTELRPGGELTTLDDRAGRSRRALGPRLVLRLQNVCFLLEEDRFRTVSLVPHFSASKLRLTSEKTCSAHQDNIRQVIFVHESTKSMSRNVGQWWIIS